MHRRQAAGGGHRHREAQHPEQHHLRVQIQQHAALEQPPTAEHHTQRQQISRIAEKIQGNVGKPCAGHATEIMRLSHGAGMSPGRVRRTVGHQRTDHSQRDRNQQPETDFPQNTLQETKNAEPNLMPFGLDSMCLRQNGILLVVW
nr:hypothetical protein [Candidatus Competibacter phosphatis]